MAQKSRNTLKRSNTVNQQSATQQLNFINKHAVVEPYPHIKVDNFYPTLLSGFVDCRERPIVFILSHMHADHLRGLTNEFEPDINWNYGPIYCSDVTYRMMLLRFPHLEPFMIPLQFGEERVIGHLS